MPSARALTVALPVLVCLGLLLFGADPGLAQVATPDGFVWRDYQDPALAARPQEPLWQSALWFLLKLGFVIGLVYASLLAYRRMLGTRAPLTPGRVQVLESVRLAGTQSLFLVQVGEEILLLGSNGAGLMVKLAQWPAAAPPPPGAELDFARTFRGAAERPDDFEGVVESSLRQAVIPPPKVD